MDSARILIAIKNDTLAGKLRGILVGNGYMKYKLRMTEDEVFERAVAMVKYSKKLCEDVEFSAEDASRTRPEFLYKVVEAVIKAGATVVNIPDTVGYAAPLEFGRLIKEIREKVNGVEKIDLSVHCHGRYDVRYRILAAGI